MLVYPMLNGSALSTYNQPAQSAKLTYPRLYWNESKASPRRRKSPALWTLRNTGFQRQNDAWKLLHNNPRYRSMRAASRYWCNRSRICNGAGQSTLFCDFGAKNSPAMALSPLIEGHSSRLAGAFSVACQT